MSAKPVILAVNHNRRNLELLAQFLGKDGFDVLGAATIEEFAQTLQGTASIQLALVDITDFDSKIWKQCEQLREKDIPLLIISPRQSAALQQESIASGAHGVLVKPLVTRELSDLIWRLLEQDQNSQTK